MNFFIAKPLYRGSKNSQNAWRNAPIPSAHSPVWSNYQARARQGWIYSRMPEKILQVLLKPKER
jgi:hypothetical protein